MIVNVPRLLIQRIYARVIVHEGSGLLAPPTSQSPSNIAFMRLQSDILPCPSCGFTITATQINHRCGVCRSLSSYSDVSVFGSRNHDKDSTLSAIPDLQNGGLKTLEDLYTGLTPHSSTHLPSAPSNALQLSLGSSPFPGTAVAESSKICAYTSRDQSTRTLPPRPFLRPVPLSSPPSANAQ